MNPERGTHRSGRSGTHPAVRSADGRGFASRAVGTAILVLILAANVMPRAAEARQTDTTTVRNVSFTADSLIVRMIDGKEVREMLNPRLEEGTTVVRSARLVDRGGGQLFFYDRVRIVDEADTLTADQVLYDRNTKIGRATGAVRLGDGEVVVTAPEGDYDTREKRADFRAGVTLVDSVSVLTSLGGSYWTEDKRAEFAGDVRLKGDSLDVASDSLTYLRETRTSTARGRVVIRRLAADGVNWIFGRRAHNEEDSGTSAIDGDVMLFTIRTDSTEVDTLMLSAGRLRSTRADSLDRYVAADSVRLWRDEFAAVADSVDFLRFAAVDSTDGRSVSRLLGSPITWFRSTQIDGDTLVVIGRGEAIDTLLVNSDAFVARTDSSSGRLQQLRGSRLVGVFRSDSLRSVEVFGQAEALHWMTKTEEREGGALKVSADRIRITLDGDDVTDLGVYDGVEGAWYAADLVSQATDLEGLAWAPGRRPDPRPFRERFAHEACRLDPAACAPEKRDLPPDP